MHEVRAQGGNTIPMVFVTTADGSKGLEAIPYTTLKADTRKAARELKKSLADKDVVGNAPAKEEAKVDESDEDMIPSDTNSGMTTWTNADGKTITAEALEVDGGKVLFKLESGKTVWYPLMKLTQESRQRLNEVE